MSVSTADWMLLVAGRQTCWPLFGSWKDDDFPDVSELRKGYWEDVPREKF